MNNNAIGLFDSGIGGISIWKAVNQLLPNENTVYLADSKNAPYGQRSKNEIIALCEKNIDFLIAKNCKAIIVACNTATTNAIKELRAKYSLPIIGIEPAIKPAALQSQTNTIGILATKGTLNSELFNRQLENYSDIKIIEQVGYGLVELIENDEILSDEMNRLLQIYLQPMIDQNIDYLVLGCSHYPFLIPEIEKIIPKNINIIDSGEAVARQTQAVLLKKNIENRSQSKSKNVFYTNGNLKVMQKILGFEEHVFELDF